MIFAHRAMYLWAKIIPSWAHKGFGLFSISITNNHIYIYAQIIMSRVRKHYFRPRLLEPCELKHDVYKNTVLENPKCLPHFTRMYTFRE